MNSKDHSAKDQPKDLAFYSNVKDVVDAIKIKELGALAKGLQVLRSQLIDAVMVRVDPTDKNTRPLVEYVQSCSDCSPIIDLWDYQTSTNIQSLECLVPDIVSLFIRLCNTPILRAFGLQLVQLVMQRHMKSLYRGVASSRIPQCQSAFRVLISMASFNQTTARDLFQSFNFQAEGFSRACRYRQLKKGNNPNRYLFDLRTLYVQFVMAFIIHGDSDIKKQVLGVKGLLNGVYTHIDEDAYQLIEETLNATYEHLISDHRVPRSTKLALFTPYILEKIGKLYGRQEPELISATDTGTPANLAHHFLLSICTVPGIGVCFKDSGWYPPTYDNNTVATDADKPDQVQNKCLAKFMLSLKPSDDLRQQELLLKILHVCPELVQTYWKSTALTLEVRLSSKWLGNATFLQKVIKLSVPSFYFGNTQLYPASPPNAMTILDNILPSVFNRSVSSKGLQHSSALVRFTTSNILAAVFQKFSNVSRQLQHVISVLKEVEEQDNENSSTSTATPASLLPSTQWQGCLDSIREELRRRLPEIQTIIKLHSEVFGKIETTSNDNSDDISEQMAQRDILQVSVFRLLRYYQECVPLTFMESHVDPSNLIPVDILSVSPSILVHLLELLLNLSDFRWGNKSAGKSVSHITTLLTLYLRTPYEHIRDLTARLVNQTLSDSFMFKHDPEEVDLWLQALPQNYMSRSSGTSITMSTEQDLVLGFLDDCFARFGKAQYRYTDQLVDLVNNTAAQQNKSHSHQIHKSLSGATTGSSSTGDSSNMMVNYEHPFSPLLLVLLERLRFNKTDKRPMIRFMSRLFLSLNTKQKLPHYLDSLTTNLKEASTTADEMDMDLDNGSTSNDWKTGQWTTQNTLKQIKTCLTQRFSDGVTGVNWDQGQNDSQFIDLISNTTTDDIYKSQTKFVDLLETLPVFQLAHNWEVTANYCANVLEISSFGPLVDYLCERHPSAANLFDYPDLQSSNTSLVQRDSVLSKLLESLPFHMTFYNAWSYSGDRTLAQRLLKQKMDSMAKYPLSCALSLTLQKLALVIIDNGDGADTDSSAIDFCFGLIQHGLHIINSNVLGEQDKADLKHLVFDHPVISHFTGALATLLHRLCSTSTYSSPLDSNSIHLCTKYLDVFGDGSKANDLLDALINVDFDALHAYCTSNDQDSFYGETIKLLISLINNVKQKALVGKSKSDHTAIPSKVFAIIARMWSSSTSGLLDTDVLSLLEFKGSPHFVNDDYRQSQRLLLNVCGELVVKHILSGDLGCTVNMADLEESCKEKAVPVSSLVMDSLSSTTSLPMTVSLVSLVHIGYRLSVGGSSSTDDAHTYLQTAMDHIIKLLTSNADATIVSDHAVFDDVYDALVCLVNEVDGFDWTRLDSESVRDYVLTTLLDNISTPAAIQFTTALVRQVYGKHTRMEPLETYVRRILDHALYPTLTAPKPIDALFKANESTPDNDENGADLQDEQRSAIIELLGTLNDIQPMILANHHGLLDALLTSYGATTLPSDRRILGILLSSEQYGEQTILPKLLMWGPGSDKARQEHAQAGTLLTASTISVETFGLIHREMMRHTFLHMPSGSSSSTLPSTTVVYDIDFFLPLFANLIASGTLDCRRFIENDSLGLTIVSLSSLNEQTRKIGYQMMDQFYVLLEHSKFRGKLPIKYLLDMLKQAIVKRSDSEVPPRLPPAVCLCVAQSLSILLLPNHYLLPSISKWLTHKPALDMNHIPMFVPLFNSTSANQKKERLWILEILASSIKTMDDYKMYSRHRVWDLTASYYNSPLADSEGKLMVLEMIKQATLVPKVTLLLIRHNGLLTWLHQILVLPSLSGPSSTTASSMETACLKSILSQIQSVLDHDTHDDDANIVDDVNGDSGNEDDDSPDKKKGLLPTHIRSLLSNQLALLLSLV